MYRYFRIHMDSSIVLTQTCEEQAQQFRNHSQAEHFFVIRSEWARDQLMTSHVVITTLLSPVSRRSQARLA
ncbi:hypothetical protein RRG08_053842 [Elysia crispata]|uniref:Uncharacterized protein n=1 Tax=Elysia crispata TaxID=231223 RepID=A0AAE1A610_9GAST|nr:hypothetical protein RRG08_053842 [Elysia crispata]